LFVNGNDLQKNIGNPFGKYIIQGFHLEILIKKFDNVNNKDYLYIK